MFARMSSSRGIMAGLDDIAMKLFIVGDIEFSLVINKSVLLFPFKEAVQESTRFFGFEGLESLSHRGFAIQAVLNVLFKQWRRNFGRAEIECCSSKTIKVFVRQYDLVVVVFSIRNFVAWLTRQSVTSTILDSWFVNEYKIIVSQEKSPASLTTREVLRSMPELKVAMISDDLEGLR
jgi:hypothetical protein